MLDKLSELHPYPPKIVYLEHNGSPLPKAHSTVMGEVENSLRPTSAPDWEKPLPFRCYRQVPFQGFQLGPCPSHAYKVLGRDSLGAIHPVLSSQLRNWALKLGSVLRTLALHCSSSR